MKKAIISGGWTSNGNFSGYNPTVVGPDGSSRIHIPGRVMEAAGFKKDSDVKFPFYAILGVREFNKVDQTTGEAMDEKIKRLQANAVFAKVEDLANALAADAVLEGTVSNTIKATATSAGLSEAQLTALLESAI